MLKQVQTMSSVPRTLGADVNFVFPGGREQVGVKENGMAREMHFAGTMGVGLRTHDGRSALRLGPSTNSSNRAKALAAP